VGGGPEFPHWLCRVLDAWDTPVAYRCRVSEIILEGKRAVGVRVLRGRKDEPDEIRCKHVVAACDVEALYERMLPPGTIDETLLQKLRDADLYDSSVTISLGLDTDPRTLGLGEEAISFYDETLTRAELRSGDPHKAGITVMAPSVRDPSLAPEGKGTVQVYVKANIADWDEWRTEPGYVRGDAYEAFKQEFTDAILARVEARVAPGLREHIEISDTATPITHWRWTGNRQGSIMGASPSPSNISAGLAHYATPVKNLLLGGMWAEYGGGVPVAVRAGVNSALLILKTERPAEFRALSAVLDGKRVPQAEWRTLPAVSRSRTSSSC
jgi:prolycopene isomerase